MAKRGRPRKVTEDIAPAKKDESVKVVQVKMLMTSKTILDDAARSTFRSLSDLVDIAILHADKAGVFDSLDVVEPAHVRRARAIIEKWRAKNGKPIVAQVAASKKKDKVDLRQGTLGLEEF